MCWKINIIKYFLTKKQETIDRWIEEHKLDIYKKRALNPLEGEILCIVMKIAKEDYEVDSDFIPSYRVVKIVNEGSEESILIDFTTNIQNIDNPIFIGHNIKGFDWQWIIKKLLKYNLLPNNIPHSIKSHHIVDTMELFSLGEYRQHTSLDTICKFLGIQGKTEGIDGSQVYDYYLAGKIDEIVDYCEQDVDALIRVYNILKQLNIK
jgi:predicted PolB exonuclease-like 3'-5' exonuclease